MSYNSKDNKFPQPGSPLRKVSDDQPATDVNENVYTLGHLSIGTNIDTKVLRVVSTDSGVIVPKMTTAEINSISSPEESEFVYDIDVGDFKYYKLGSGWVSLSGTLSGKVTLSSPTTPPSIVSDIDNYNPSGLNSTNLLRLSSAGNYNITGLQRPSPEEPQLIVLRNVGTNNITLSNEDASSIASNRFQLGGSKTLQPGESATIVYDPISLRWFLSGVSI